MARSRPQHRLSHQPDFLMFSSDGGCYTPERDGTLAEYLTTHDGHSAFPLFKGLEQFELLRREEWFAPRMSIIRLMWNVGRDDEHFAVIEDFQLQGIGHGAHAGREGIHDPADVLQNAPPFEATNLYGPAWVRQQADIEAKIRADYERVLSAQQSQ